MVIDEGGCEAADFITIIVDETRKVFVPNVFSPNSDGINDHFAIQGGPDLTLIRSLSIYDRWGASIFNINNLPIDSPDARWFGDKQGEAVDVGVYLYVAEVEFTDGHIERISGEVLVLR
jgi:gliding motility-associated-like protein